MGDRRKCQTYAASPAEPGGLPGMLDGHAYEPMPEPSTRGVVDITQDVRLKLQILQSMLDHIADADDTDKVAVAQNRHVAHAMAGHQLIA